MKHVDEGEIRRMIDEPETAGDEASLHLERCAECRERAAAIRRDAEFAAGAMQGSVEVDARAALLRVERALAAPKAAPRWYVPAGLAAAAAFALALVFTPLGSYASAFLTIFQPKEFVPINISSADFRQLRLAPQADELGTMRVVQQQRHSAYPTLGAARDHLAFTPRVPAQVPASVGSARSFSVSTPGEYVYTFSASKARAFAAKSHKTLAPMPAALNGTTVRVRVGQTFVAAYGAPKERTRDGKGLTLVEMPVPTVSATGASFQELERYMLSMPGISPDLATQLRALGDLQNRMPVPIDIGKQNAQQVTVDGVQGLAIGDNTGLGAGVMWEKNGMLYGIMGGSVTMDQVIALANGLR